MADFLVGENVSKEIFYFQVFMVYIVQFDLKFSEYVSFDIVNNWDENQKFGQTR